MKIQITWTETWDDNDNSIWEGNSPYTDEDGAPLFQWRLKQRLVANRIEWFEAHDADILPKPDDIESWLTLYEAKLAIQKTHDEIISRRLESPLAEFSSADNDLNEPLPARTCSEGECCQSCQ